MWCSCSRGEFSYTAQEEGDLWVHAACLRPSRLVWEKLTDHRAPKDAVAIKSVYGRANGVNEVTYITHDKRRVTCLYYHPYPNKVDMNTPRDLLLEMWRGLDSVIDDVRAATDKTTDTYKADVVKADTVARMLALIMSPFYPDHTEVLKESMRRWKARQAGTEHETPGLAEDIWNPARRFDGTPYSEENEKRVRAGGKPAAAAPKATGNRVPDSAVETCRQGIEMGMFTVQQMADTYKMSVTELKNQLGLA